MFCTRQLTFDTRLRTPSSSQLNSITEALVMQDHVTSFKLGCVVYYFLMTQYLK